MGLLRNLEAVIYSWWYKYDLPEPGDSDYEALTRYWQGENAEMTVISETPNLMNFLLAASLLLYELVLQLSGLGVIHWYLLTGISSVITYFYLNAYREYRLFTWEEYITTKVASVVDRQRLADLHVSDPTGYYILLRRLMGARFHSNLSYERLGSKLVPVLRLWCPGDLVEKLWIAGSPLHVYLAYFQHNALVLVLLSAALLRLSIQCRVSLQAHTVLTEFTVFEHTSVLRVTGSRSGYPH